jgi:hypothetical protein
MRNRCPQIPALGRSIGEGNREAWMQPQAGRVSQRLLMVRPIAQHELTTALIAGWWGDLTPMCTDCE